MKTKLSKWQLGVRLFAGVAGLIFVGFLLYLIMALDIFNNPTILRDYISNHLYLGALAFFALQILQIVIAPIPGGVLTLVGFLAFGPIGGFFLNYLSILLGSLLLFLLTRHLGRSFITHFIPEDKLDYYEDKLTGAYLERGLVLIMLLPFSPADISVIIAALTRLSLKRFSLIMLLCRPIGIISYFLLWTYGGQFFQGLF